MVRHAAVLFALALAALPQVASSQASAVELPRTSSPAKARLYFISPADGQVVKGPVTVRFGLQEMGVAPAGV